MIGWYDKQLEEAYQILWEVRQKQKSRIVLRELEDAMDAIERCDDRLTDVTL